MKTWKYCAKPGCINYVKNYPNQQLYCRDCLKSQDQAVKEHEFWTDVASAIPTPITYMRDFSNWSDNSGSMFDKYLKQYTNSSYTVKANLSNRDTRLVGLAKLHNQKVEVHLLNGTIKPQYDTTIHMYVPLPEYGICFVVRE
jgi:hypothetical protein